MEAVLKYDCQDDDQEVYVIQPGERVCIYGSCSIVCLSGNAKLNDYHLPPTSYATSSLLSMSGPLRMDIPSILQVMESDTNYKHARLKFRLKEVAPMFYTTIMENIGQTKPAVFVFSKTLKKSEETVASLIPNFLIYSSKPRSIQKPSSFLCRRMDLFVYPVECDNALQMKLDSLRTIRKNGQKVSILPIGHKGAGKSNLMRSIINRCLSGSPDENVYVLDCDIGQSEFTPCGCLSLHKITSPVLDKPYAHQKPFLQNAYFYGDISVNKIDLYFDIFERLWNTFCEISEPGSVCIINSMGWLEEIGEQILLKIIDIAKPELFVEIYRDSTESRFHFPKNCESKKLEIMANNVPPENEGPLLKRLPPALIRELTLIGYFSHILPRPHLSLITEVPPYTLPFSKTTICLPIDLLVDDSRILSSINTQTVAICIKTPELKYRRIRGSDSLPKIAILDAKSPALKCIGFAIIRGICLEKKEVYVLSPVDLVKLDEEPILVRGNRIFTPQQIYSTHQFNQSAYVLNLGGEKRPVEVIDDLYQPSVVTSGHKKSRRN